MPGATPTPWSLPYPVGTDPVRDGDNTMQALAERVAAILTTNLGGDLLPYGTNGTVMTWGGNVNTTRRSGWVWVYFNTSAASWAGGATIATLGPLVRPPVAIYADLITTATGLLVSVLIYPNGAVTVVAASGNGGGLVGALSFPSTP